jgi:hypothetical protein
LTEEREISAQVAPKIAKDGSTRGRPESGINAATRELGIDRTEAQRAVKIAGIAPEAKAEARALHLDDNQSALLKAAKAPTKEEQLRALREHAASRSASGPQRITKEARERVERERQEEANAVPIREGDEDVTRAAVRREIRLFIQRLGSLLTRTALIPHAERLQNALEIAALLGVNVSGGAQR